MIERYNGVEHDPEGVYVMFEDYERLRSEGAIMRKAIEQAMDQYTDHDDDDLRCAQVMYDVLGRALVTASTRQDENKLGDYTHYSLDEGL